MALTPGGIVAWLIVGLIAGWAAGKVSRGHGFGLIGDLAVGLIGALVGGLIAGIFFSQGSAAFGSGVVVAFLGAVFLLTLIRLAGRRRSTA